MQCKFRFSNMSRLRLAKLESRWAALCVCICKRDGYGGCAGLRGALYAGAIIVVGRARRCHRSTAGGSARRRGPTHVCASRASCRIANVSCLYSMCMHFAQAYDYADGGDGEIFQRRRGRIA